MQSPLPDSSALEAGILQDTPPTRITRVQDNVRNLLRNSVLSSIRGTPTSPTFPIHPSERHWPRSPLRSQIQHTHNHTHAHFEPEVLPSPNSSTPTTTSTNTSTTSSASCNDHAIVPGVLFPPLSYTRAVQQMAHHSTAFNTRALAAINHPDLSDPSLAVFLQQKSESRQQRAWKRSRSGRGGRSGRSGRVGGYRGHRGGKRRPGGQACLCFVSGVLLAFLVATYLALTLSVPSCSGTAFHLPFIIGILLATILFAHTVIRMCLFNRGLARLEPFHLVAPPRRRHGHSRHRHHHHRYHDGRCHDVEQQVQDPFGDEFAPASPIPVVVAADDEVRPDSREARPTEGANRLSQRWDKGVDAVLNPPPAYGRWRGSVRANPDLLHWAPSPTTPKTPGLPSPTYEEAMQAVPVASGGPPSYMTRESPARQGVVQGGEENVAPAQVAEPEMVEGRGIGRTE